MPRAVIFDFDGVIADTERLHSETFRRVLSEEKIFLTDRDHDERFLGINDRDGFTKAFAEVGRPVSAGEVKALIERKSVYYSAGIARVEIFPGVKDLVSLLAPKCLLAIASGGRRAEIEEVLRAHELREDFLAILSADEVKRSKPAPDPFLEALLALRRAAPARSRALRPADCLVIEDSIPGIRAARAAGMRCIAVAHTFPKERLVEADQVVERLSDLRALFL
jgi:beta-phosphoglucomutase-like phosphatase (HAD superfamily)